MIPDITGRAGCQQRIGQRMQADIGVRMAVEPLVMRNFDAAECDEAARDQTVHIIAISGTDIRQWLRRWFLVGHGFILESLDWAVGGPGCSRV